MNEDVGVEAGAARGSAVREVGASGVGVVADAGGVGTYEDLLRLDENNVEVGMKPDELRALQRRYETSYCRSGARPSSSGAEGGEACHICIEPFAQDNRVIRLKCGTCLLWPSRPRRTISASFPHHPVLHLMIDTRSRGVSLARHATPCHAVPGHQFHTSCLLQWLRRKKTCPTCRCDVHSPVAVR